MTDQSPDVVCPMCKVTMKKDEFAIGYILIIINALAMLFFVVCFLCFSFIDISDIYNTVLFSDLAPSQYDTYIIYKAIYRATAFICLVGFFVVAYITR